MNFGETTYSGSRFIFWSLAPFLLISGIATPLLVWGDWNLVKIIVIGAWSACSLLAIPALYDSDRFWWAARSVTGIIFLAYSAYVIYEFFFTDKPLELTPRSETSPLSSILGFIFIGLPCMWYTFLGRFSLRPEVEDYPYDEDWEEEDNF